MTFEKYALSNKKVPLTATLVTVTGDCKKPVNSFTKVSVTGTFTDFKLTGGGTLKSVAG